MAGRSAAKRTTPRRTSGAQREGRAVPPGKNVTSVTTGEVPAGGSGGSGGSSGSGKGLPGTKVSGSGRWNDLTKFLKQVRVEAGRVTWPTKIELAQATRVVLWTLMVFMVYLGVLDWLFIKIFNWGQHRYR